MAWPVSQDYNEAVQNPGTSFADAELRAGQAATNALGIPRPCSGNFADVYEMHCGPSKWAVKCFTRQVHGLRERYAAISQYLRQARLPFTVDFQYLEQGIRICGQWFPIVKMRWVEGLTLNTFVRDNLDKPALLDALGQIWARMARRLRDAQVAHADVQHGNVLLVPGSNAQSLAVKLIDYDGMWVPALATRPSGELGHANYQHPQRLREGIYGPEVDRFPLLAVAAALRCLRVGGQALWERYDTGDNLLFRESDLSAPHQSPLFAELLKLPDPLARSLAAQVMAAAQKPLDQTPLLEEPQPEKPAAKAARVIPAPAAPGQPAGAALQFGEEEPLIRRKRGRSANKSLAPLVAAGVVLATLLAGGGIFLAMSGREADKPSLKPRAANVHLDKDKKGPEGADEKTAPAHTGRKGEDAGDGPKTRPADLRPSPPQAFLLPAGPPGEVRQWPSGIGGVWGLAFSPDGRHLLSAGDRGLVLWDADTGREVRTFSGHEGRVWSVAFSADGRQALSGGTDKTVRLWDVDSGNQAQLFQGHTDQVDAVAFIPGVPRVLSVSRDGTGRVWNSRSGTESGRLGEGPLSGYALAADLDRKSQRVLFAAPENSVCLWDVGSQRELRRLKGSTAHVYALAFAPNGKAAASGGGDNTIRLWDLEAGDEVGRLDKHTKPVQSLAFLRDGRLLSASDDGTIRLWEPASGQECCRLEGHTGPARGAAPSPDGRYAVSGSLDQTVRLWRLPPPDLLGALANADVGEVRKYEGHSAAARRISLSPDGRRALTAGYDGAIILWDLVKGEQLLRLPQTDPHIHAVAFCPGNRALSGSKDGTLHLWDLSDGREIGTWAGHTGDVFHLSVSADGRHALTCGHDPAAILWDVATGKPLHRLDVGVGGAPVGAFSPDGRQALTAGNDGFVRLWDVATGQELRKFDKGKGGEGVAISPDGRRILASRNNVLVMWGVETGKELLRLEGHTAGTFAVAFTPDGRRAVSCSGDRSVRLWDLEAGKEERAFTGHADMVGDVVCLPDGRYALSASFDRTLRLWRLPFATLVVGDSPRRGPPATTEKPAETTAEKPSEKVPDDRTPVPARDALEEAGKQLREMYRVEYAQRKPEEVLALAGKLLQRGQRPAETPALRFALLHEAGNLAAQVPDLPKAQQAVDALAKLYVVSPSTLKVDFLTVAARAARLPAAHKAVGESALASAEEAITADDYPAALKLLAIAGNAGSKSANRLLQIASARRTAAAERLQKEYEKVKDSVGALEKQPKDPAASRVVGRFRCFDKEDWDRGLPLLAQGDDAALAGLARKDLGRPGEAGRQVEVAQEWWDLADRETEPLSRMAVQRRAKFWYRQALPQLAGTEKSKAEDRLKLVVNKVSLKPGLTAELFADGDLTRRVKRRVDYQVNFNWGTSAPDEGVPADNFSIRWRGYLVPPRPGAYTLILLADDGARLFLDGAPVLDTWEKLGRYEATVVLGEKPYRLEVQYHEKVGPAYMSFRWALEGSFGEQLVPLEALFHDSTQEKFPGK